MLPLGIFVAPKTSYSFNTQKKYKNKTKPVIPMTLYRRQPAAPSAAARLHRTAEVHRSFVL